VLAPEKEALESEGINVETVVHHGKIADTLLELGNQYGISQIFIGRQGESRVQAAIFGSVSAALIQTTSVPVTVVP